MVIMQSGLPVWFCAALALCFLWDLLRFFGFSYLGWRGVIDSGTAIGSDEYRELTGE